MKLYLKANVFYQKKKKEEEVSPGHGRLDWGVVHIAFAFEYF